MREGSCAGVGESPITGPSVNFRARTVFVARAVDAVHGGEPYGERRQFRPREQGPCCGTKSICAPAPAPSGTEVRSPPVAPTVPTTRPYTDYSNSGLPPPSCPSPAANGAQRPHDYQWLGGRALPDADLGRRRVGHDERSGSSEPGAGRLGWLNQNYGLGVVIDSRGQSQHEFEVTCA